MTQVTATSVQIPGGLCSPGEWKLKADPTLDVDRAKSDRGTPEQEHGGGLPLPDTKTSKHCS